MPRVGADIHLYALQDATPTSVGSVRTLRLSSFSATQGKAWRALQALYGAVRAELPPAAQAAWDSFLEPLLGRRTDRREGEPECALTVDEVEALRHHGAHAFGGHRAALCDAFAAELRDGRLYFRDADDVLRFIGSIFEAVIDLASRREGLLVTSESMGWD